MSCLRILFIVGLICVGIGAICGVKAEETRSVWQMHAGDSYVGSKIHLCELVDPQYKVPIITVTAEADAQTWLGTHWRLRLESNVPLPEAIMQDKDVYVMDLMEHTNLFFPGYEYECILALTGDKQEITLAIRSLTDNTLIYSLAPDAADQAETAQSELFRIETGSEVCNMKPKLPFQQREVGQLGYPLSMAFRWPEIVIGSSDIVGSSYEIWEQSFSRFNIIIGKVLNEELSRDITRNLEYFNRFACKYPEKLVLLHFNGTARDPVYEGDGYFSGHWLHFAGTNITGSIDKNTTIIKVKDTSVFRLGLGAYKQSNDDLSIMRIGAGGLPDWNSAEHLKLVDIDAENGTIEVIRGAYNSTPAPYPAGSYIAPLVSQGPWGTGNNTLWLYNFGTNAPRDRQNRSAADILAQELREKFAPSGPLALFDGLEFDILFGDEFCSHNLAGRSVDVDGDGKGDNGVFSGVNTYRQGVVDFARSVREQLGSGKLILADGDRFSTQRAFGIFNGVEFEGWPQLSDSGIREWSSGLNNARFWQVNGYEPVFSYINHKYWPASDIPFSTTRLVLAAALFNEMAFGYIIKPATDIAAFPVWDELRLGAADVFNWLGRPVADAVHLAETAPDLLEGEDRKWDDEPLRKYRLQGVNVPGEDLFVRMNVKAEPMAAYSPEIARRLFVRWVPQQTATIGSVTRSGAVENVQSQWTWVNDKWFVATFYFPGVGAGPGDLEFEIESTEPFYLGNLSLHAAPDIMYQEFANGLVVANPSPVPQQVDLGALFPAEKFKRVTATVFQDVQINNGEMQEQQLLIAGKDAIFLQKVTQYPFGNCGWASPGDEAYGQL